MSRDFQDEIECLGIEASPSFVREPEGNGVAERFIRTLKENLLWVRVFDTIEELRQALHEFARHYNENWLVARHGYQTPTQVRAAQLRVANAKCRRAILGSLNKRSRLSQNRAAVHKTRLEHLAYRADALEMLPRAVFDAAPFLFSRESAGE
jgi:hypothetical protein